MIMIERKVIIKIKSIILQVNEIIDLEYLENQFDI